MAHEKGSPNLPLIAFFAVLSIVTLALLQPAFVSYFNGVFGAKRYTEQEARPEYYEAAKRHQEDELEALASGPLPISRAMKMVAEQRDSLPQIAPKPLQSRDALAGWGAHPDYEALIDPPAPPLEPVPAPASLEEGDGGSEGSPLRRVEAGGERAPER